MIRSNAQFIPALMVYFITCRNWTNKDFIRKTMDSFAGSTKTELSVTFSCCTCPFYTIRIRIFTSIL